MRIASIYTKTAHYPKPQTFKGKKQEEPPTIDFKQVLKELINPTKC